MATRASFQNLADKLINSTFSDFRDPLTVDQLGEFDYSTQSAPIIATNQGFGIRTDFDASQFNGESVQVGDYKILIEQQSLSIDLRADNVSMTFNGRDVEIVNVSEDAARAVYTVQARDK